MIKSIFSKESLVEGCMQTCGFVNRGIKKEILGMREFAFKLRIPFLTMNQFSIEHEADLFIMLPKSKVGKYTDYSINSKFDYLIIVNGKVIRRFEPVEVVQECFSFPFFQIKAVCHKRIELYFADEKMNVLNKKIEGESAFIAQMALSTLKGLVLINPIRHKGTLSIKTGYEGLFSHTKSFLPEFNEASKAFQQNLEFEEDNETRLLKFTSLNSASSIKASECKEYAELKARMLTDYRVLKQSTKKEIKSLIEDPDIDQLKAYVNILVNFDAGN